jgi:type II secretory pathway component PulK
MIARLLREERGMVLGLAIIVVVVIGVVGAGLLTFVSADLQAVVAVNRGEQAFELAEAGVEIAKAHLAHDPRPAGWSSGELRADGVGDNSVSVSIEQMGDGSFEVVSTVRYGETRRKIEALFTIEAGEPKLLGWRELYE